MHFFPEARSTYVSARHGLERARTYAEAAAVAVGNGTGHMRAHAPSGRRSSRELQERAAAASDVPITLPAPIMQVSTVPRASAPACMCRCLSRLASGIAAFIVTFQVPMTLPARRYRFAIQFVVVVEVIFALLDVPLIIMYNTLFCVSYFQICGV